MSRQLGALSGLAILLIVLNHAIEIGLSYSQNLGYASPPQWQSHILSTLQALGILAVPVFLFISGNFLAYAARGDPPKISMKFLYSSLKHILIPYLIWSILFYVLIYFHEGIRHSFPQYIKDLLVGYPFHFIPLLVVFYILSPILVRIAKRYPVLLLAAILLSQLLIWLILNPSVLGGREFEWGKLLVPPIIGVTYADWAIYFPLGLVAGLHSTRVLSLAKKYAWLFASLTLFIFIVGFALSFFKLPMTIFHFVFPLPFVCLIPAIRRDSIPFVRFFENTGKRSYGIYLTHLLIIDIILWSLELFIPKVFEFPIVLLIVLFILGFEIPLLVMNLASKGPIRPAYRYVFG